MFGWFSPRCPVGTRDKAWTETRMAWIADRFGLDWMKSVEVVLPGDPVFDMPEGTEEEAALLFGRLCEHTGVDPARVQLVVSPDQHIYGRAGQYERDPETGRVVIRVARSQFDDGAALVATLVHELSHELLLGGGLLDEATPDHEWVTDLMTVCLGFGVFSANATIREKNDRVGNQTLWSMWRHGYLPSHLFGYALALFALARGELDPTWAAPLRLDAAEALRDSLRYLRKTRDSLFLPETYRPHQPPLTDAEAAERMRTGSVSARLSALWQIGEHRLTDAACLREVLRCLGDDDPAVFSAAASCLPVFESAATPAVPLLRAALHSRDEERRGSAAVALATLRHQPAEVLPDLCRLLEDESRDVFISAASGLELLALPIEHEAVGRLLAGLERGLVDCDDGLIGTSTRALHAVAPDPETWVREYFGERDREFVDMALAALKDHKRVAVTQDREESPGGAP